MEILKLCRYNIENIMGVVLKEDGLIEPGSKDWGDQSSSGNLPD